jgi:hypothetical protein
MRAQNILKNFFPHFSFHPSSILLPLPAKSKETTKKSNGKNGPNT